MRRTSEEDHEDREGGGEGEGVKTGGHLSTLIGAAPEGGCLRLVSAARDMPPHRIPCVRKNPHLVEIRVFRRERPRPACFKAGRDSSWWAGEPRRRDDLVRLLSAPAGAGGGLPDPHLLGLPRRAARLQ